MTLHNTATALAATDLAPLAKLALIWIAATHGSGIVDLRDPTPLRHFMNCSSDESLAALSDLKKAGYLLPRDDQDRWMLDPNTFEIEGGSR